MYWLGASLISSTTSYKYLGVHLTANLSWAPHINIVTTNTSRTPGHLKRHFKCARSHVRKLTHETYVRPKLEYASAIWNPHHKYLTDLIEAIHNRADPLITSTQSHPSSVTLIKQSHSFAPLRTPRKISLFASFITFTPAHTSRIHLSSIRHIGPDDS